MAAPIEKSYLWTTGGAGDGASTYTRADWATILQIVAGCNDGEGVGAGWGNLLAATAATNKITVDTGVAIVDGKPYICSAGGDITIPSPTAYNRIDRIVLRADWTAQTVRLTRIAGTESASPTPPAATRTRGTTFDLYLYQVTVTPAGVVTISTDEREWAMVAAAQIADGAVTGAKIASAAVTEAKIASAAVTEAKIGSGAVTNAKIGSAAVDDTKCGNRVPKFTRRLGGSATDWSVAGTTSYTPTTVLMQGGIYTGTTNAAGEVTVTFPTAFAYAPIVLVSGLSVLQTFEIISITTSAVTVRSIIHNVSGPNYHNAQVFGDVTFSWLAVGPG